MTLSNLPQTEIVEQRYSGLDTWSDSDVLSALLEGQKRALASLDSALGSLAAAAHLAADRLAGGGRLIYLASGSPALMSLADALELPQTYGIPADRIIMILADSTTLPHRLDGSREDKGAEARAEVRQLEIGPQDCVIATSASGTTPFTVEGMQEAKILGAGIIAIAGNAGSPLLRQADVPVLLSTGAEVISGSTRMGAGTAQKAALNMLSTLIGVRLGHVYDGLMVNVLADNQKLRGRASRIIVQITGADLGVAQAALEQTSGVVKPAILIAAGAVDVTTAEEILMQSRGNVRQALAKLADKRKAVS